MMCSNYRSRKLINSVDDCVRDNLIGYISVNPGARLLENANIIVRHDLEELKEAGKVSLLSGGGSGHEPAMAGYVGQGMLTASVHGSIFASPPAAVILAAIRTIALNNSAGALVIVLNYTGDRLNFGLAVERAKLEGLKVDMIVIAEDCALVSKDKSAGRRGLCGAVLMYKIAGAMAEEGRSLPEIKTAVLSAAAKIGTIGISLSPCCVPGSGPSFILEEDEMELGLGVHGEAGISRLKMQPAAETVKLMLGHMTKEESASCFNLSPGDHLCLMLNNLGGTSQLEMNIVAKEAIEYLETFGAYVDRAYSGTLFTSLEMAGISLTLFTIGQTELKYLDAKTSAPSWPKPYLPNDLAVRKTPPLVTSSDETATLKICDEIGAELSKYGQDLLKHSLSTACQALISSEGQLNQLDQVAGDGDCGSTLKCGAQEILNKLNNNEIDVSYPKAMLLRLAQIAEITMGGCSGALYSLLFTGAAQAFESHCTPASWCNAILSGLNMIKKYGGAEEGDRTMIDALSPAHASLSTKIPHSRTSQEILDAFGQAVSVAEEAAAATTELRAKAGRASYIDPIRLTMPDPGAHAVGIWMRAVYEAIKQKMKAMR